MILKKWNFSKKLFFVFCLLSVQIILTNLPQNIDRQVEKINTSVILNFSKNKSKLLFTGLFPYLMLSQITEHSSLQSKSLGKNIARASGGANNLHPLS